MAAVISDNSAYLVDNVKLCRKEYSETKSLYRDGQRNVWSISNVSFDPNDGVCQTVSLRFLF